MSQEVFKMLQGIDSANYDLQIVLQCAPLLTGIKPANLLTVKKSSVEYVIDVFNESNISYYVLNQSEKATTFFLYRRDETAKQLSDERVSEVLKGFGYTRFDIDSVLDTFKSRYDRYISLKSEFPHEMGMLLGYPVEDVLGFVKNNGKNYLYSGYWKVYHDAKRKIELFDEYNKAQEQLVKLVYYGVGIKEMIV